MDEELLLKLNSAAESLFKEVALNYVKYLIKNKSWNSLRRRLDTRIEYLERVYGLTNDPSFEHALFKANAFLDLVIDLIEKEVDGERESEQIKSITE